MNRGGKENARADEREGIRKERLAPTVNEIETESNPPRSFLTANDMIPSYENKLGTIRHACATTRAFFVHT